MTLYVLVGSEIPSLREVYSRGLRLSSYSSSSDTSPFIDKSALASQSLHQDHGNQHIGGFISQNSSFGRETQPNSGKGFFGGGRGGRGGGGRGHGEPPTCDYCGRKYHTRATCYALHGRPPRPPPSAHVASSESVGGSTPFAPSTSNTVTISNDEYSKFLQYQAAHQASLPTTSLAQLGNPTECFSYSSQPKPWVIDSGASDHMTGNPDIFSQLNLYDSLPHVTLADGSQTSVKGIGHVKPTGSLSLSYVLYIPQFPLNLLSVSKLTKQLNCSVTFFPHSVLIQDLEMRRMIGKGIESRGIYHFNPSSSPIACQASITPLHIHCHLGHPSLDKLKLFMPSLGHLKSLDCESCQLGKHHRASYKSRVDKH